MNPVITLLSALALSQETPSFLSFIEKEVKMNPSKESFIMDLGNFTDELVEDYEQAVILGTTDDYAELTKILHYQSFNKGIQETCPQARDLDLRKCVDELICSGKVWTNFSFRPGSGARNHYQCK